MNVVDQRQRRAREPVLIHGDVTRRVGVVGAAVRFHHFVEFARSVFFRAVEHHVLEEVRDAGRARALVARSDAIKNVERDVRNVVVGLHEHLHPVFQRARRDRKFLLLLRECSGLAATEA